MLRPMAFLAAGDFLAAICALFLGALLRHQGLSSGDTLLEGGLRLLFFALILVFSSYFCELYRQENLSDRLDLAAHISVALMLSFFSLSALYYLIPSVMIGRGALALSLVIFGIFQYFIHVGLLALMILPGIAQRVLILGVGPLAETIESVVQENKVHYIFSGFVDPVSERVTVPVDRIVGKVEDIAAVVNAERADRLVVAITERRGVLPVRALLRCKLAGLDIVDVLRFYEQLTGKLLIENIQPSWFIYSNGFRVSMFMRCYKRVFDILFSLVGIVVAAPLWPLVALMVKFDSPGPVIFSQKRVGAQEKSFYVYKFRTMRCDAEKETGAVWAQQDDPRITRVGKFLRKSRLDEIPQLFNVLKGDMSFIGPRPERPEFVDTLSEKIPYYSNRHFMKPGVTGWAQVCYPYGSSEEDALEKLRYDLYYIKNYSLLLDFLIIFETIKVVLFGRGGR